jgi:hypothetical protein
MYMFGFVKGGRNVMASIVRIGGQAIALSMASAFFEQSEPRLRNSRIIRYPKKHDLIVVVGTFEYMYWGRKDKLRARQPADTISRQNSQLRIYSGLFAEVTKISITKKIINNMRMISMGTWELFWKYINRISTRKIAKRLHNTTTATKCPGSPHSALNILSLQPICHKFFVLEMAQTGNFST